MIPTLCNFDRIYENARDEYMCGYLIRIQSYEGPDDYPDKVEWLYIQKPGKIDLARVSVNKIVDRSQYTFYVGWDSGNNPIWSSVIQKRKPLFEIPEGWGGVLV